MQCLFTVRHPYLDAGLIGFRSDSPVELLQLSTRTPEFGEEVWTASYPMTLGLFITPGIVSGLNVLSSASYRTSSAVYFGSSGGPVIDEGGRVIGILTGVNMYKGRIIVPHMSHFISIESISNWLRNQRVQ